MKKIPLLQRSVSMYIVTVIVFIGFLGVVIFGASVRHVMLGNNRLGSFGEGLVMISEFPSMVRDVFVEVFGSGRLVQIDTRFKNLDGFKKDGKVPFGAKNDNGYLLLSSYDAEKGQSVVQLIRIVDQISLYEWAPNIEKLAELDQIDTYYDHAINRSNFRVLHPLLQDDGGIVFTSPNSPIFKIDACSRVNMSLDGTFHHSIETDADGNYWVPSVMYPSSFEGVLSHRDDAIAQISPKGEVLFKKSIAEMLYENGYRGLLAAGFKMDPIHLNDIQPAFYNSPYWEKGDLLISARNISTILLYRPSTNKIIWLKTGPWMNQHDVNFIEDHKLSVFSNNVISDPEGAVLMGGYNNVYLYNFQTDEVSTPYNNAMKAMKVKTLTEGRGTILGNGDVFVEEQNNGRILRMSPDNVQWEYVRRVDDDHIALLNWSRYLTYEQVAPILSVLQSTKCQ
jgi:hypothetical protein